MSGSPEDQSNAERAAPGNSYATHAKRRRTQGQTYGHASPSSPQLNPSYSRSASSPSQTYSSGGGHPSNYQLTTPAAPRTIRPAAQLPGQGMNAEAFIADIRSAQPPQISRFRNASGQFYHGPTSLPPQSYSGKSPLAVKHRAGRVQTHQVPQVCFTS